MKRTIILQILSVASVFGIAVGVVGYWMHLKPEADKPDITLQKVSLYGADGMLIREWRHVKGATWWTSSGATHFTDLSNHVFSVRGTFIIEEDN